jgi:ElaB/YqjD/DUF883 family membrane-anchored ribosome-binding protein
MPIEFKKEVSQSPKETPEPASPAESRDRIVGPAEGTDRIVGPAVVVRSQVSGQSEFLSPEPAEIRASDYADLQDQVSKLTEEIGEVREELGEQIGELRKELREGIKRLVKEFKEAIAQIKPQPDEYARQVLEETIRNEEAYKREEPELLRKFPGQFAAFCNGELVAVGSDRREVTLKAMQARPGVGPYIRKIGEEIPVIPAGRP